MKKYLNYVLIIVIVLSLAISPIKISADSGFDSDFGSSGGSSSSHSSSSSYGSSSSSSSYNSSSSSSETDAIMLVFIIIIIIILILINNKHERKYISLSEEQFKKKKERETKNEIIGYLVLVIVCVLLCILLLGIEVGLFLSIILLLMLTPSYFMIVNALNDHNKLLRRVERDFFEDESLVFEEDPKFEEKAFKIYKDVQIAWMNMDLEPVRSVLADEMYNMYKLQLETLKMKHQQNIMEDIEYVKSRIKNITEVDGKQEIEVIMQVTCSDYIIDTDTEEIVRGDRCTVVYTYSLTFIRNKKITKVTCPNCGNELEGSSGECKYCRSVIVHESNEYTLTKKQMLKQRKM